MTIAFHACRVAWLYGRAWLLLLRKDIRAWRITVAGPPPPRPGCGCPGCVRAAAEPPRAVTRGPVLAEPPRAVTSGPVPPYRGPVLPGAPVDGAPLTPGERDAWIGICYTARGADAAEPVYRTGETP